MPRREPAGNLLGGGNKQNRDIRRLVGQKSLYEDLHRQFLTRQMDNQARKLAIKRRHSMSHESVYGLSPMSHRMTLPLPLREQRPGHSHPESPFLPTSSEFSPSVQKIFASRRNTSRTQISITLNSMSKSAHLELTL
jgi:hypothetical protein